ncbi:MAG: hypothetical protein ACI86H_000176 [bacterium]|jgi:hypothetical protein
MSKQIVELTPPIKPAPDECCAGGACCPCVWDQYYDELAEYQKQSETTETTKEQLKNNLYNFIFPSI